MTTLHQYENRLDEQKERLRVEDGYVVCDLGDSFRVHLKQLPDESSVVQHARALEECVKLNAMRPEEIIKKFVTLANLHNGLNLPVDEVVWETMLYYKRADEKTQK